MTLKKALTLLACTSFGLAASLPAQASAETPPPRVAHYSAQQVDSLGEAIANLRHGNARLDELLAGDMNDDDIHDVHSMSYTLEDALLALAKEAQALHKIVADMHFSSEGLDREAVIDYGRQYLQRIHQLLPPAP